MQNIASYTIDKSSNYLVPARDAAQLTMGLAKSNILSSSDVETMESYFYEQLFIYPQFSGIYYGTANGEFIMASRYNKYEKGGFYTKIISQEELGRKTSLIFRGKDFRVTERRFDPTDTYDPRERPWFKTAQEASKPIWTSPYVFFTSKKPGITTANPVYGPNGKLRGVIGVDIAIDELSTFLSKLKVSEHGLAFIMDRSGDVIAYPDMSKIRQPNGDTIRLTRIDELDDPLARMAYESLELDETGKPLLEEPVFTSFALNGENYHAMFAPFSNPQWPWVIGIYLPENDYLGTLKRNGLLNIGISVIAVLLAGLLGLAVARRIDSARKAAEAADHAKSRFLARMSHEIRTPMNALLGASELLHETELSPEQQRYLKLFSNAGEVLHELVNDVLDLAKIEARELRVHLAPFHLRETINNSCSVLSLGAQKKGLDFRCFVAPTVPDHLEGDAIRIKQVLVNLIGNATKFTHTGSIDVRVERASSEHEDQVTLDFSVTDTGIGIPDHMQGKVFENFSQVEDSPIRSTGGTGLGLAICRHLVELMGGTITLESTPGQGSCFLFRLSLGKAKTEVEGTPPPLADARPFLRVLLVDDDESNRLIMSMFITGAGHQVTLTTDGEEAIAAFASGDFDLVLMDIEMPVMDGYEATHRIRDHESKHSLAPTPIVALTAHTLPDTEERDQLSEFSECLTKPIKKGDLLAMLDRYASA
ncbi:MAG: response regulator, partial [Proteobacteria bacterium]|nr:response regulator [Pseudomonadota bacterium]